MKNKKEHAGFYENMMKRVNLQSLGLYIRESAQNSIPDETTISERMEKADSKLYKELEEHFDHESIELLEPIIWSYVTVSTTAHFSLGMKAGAKLALLLVDEHDTDF